MSLNFARYMAEHVSTTLLTFGPEPRMLALHSVSEQIGGLHGDRIASAGLGTGLQFCRQVGD
jgi:hypothetical protein